MTNKLMTQAGPRLAMTMRTRLEQQRSPFARSLLPLTMEFARVVASILGPHLGDQPAEWPFEDRVLSLLAPVLRSDIVSFHSKESGDISMMFAPHQLEHLDQGLLEMLVAFVVKESPESLKALLAAARAT